MSQPVRNALVLSPPLPPSSSIPLIAKAFFVLDTAAAVSPPTFSPFSFVSLKFLEEMGLVFLPLAADPVLFLTEEWVAGWSSPSRLFFQSFVLYPRVSSPSSFPCAVPEEKGVFFFFF